MLTFGAFTHVVCCATVYYLNSVNALNPVVTSESTLRFAEFFLLPVMILFLPFYLTAAITQFVAFVKGLTPYPKLCCIFTFLAGLIVVVITRFMGNVAIAYALSTAWISLGALWTFGGLLVTMKKADM